MSGEIPGLCLLILSAATALGTEITGKVTEVKGDIVTIVAENTKARARAGDSVAIYFQIPGLEDLAKVGSGQVVGVEDGRIVARIDQRTGTLAVGQIAKIQASATRAPDQVAGPVSGEPKKPDPAGRPTAAAGERWVLDEKTALDRRTKLMWMRADFLSVMGRTTRNWFEAIDWARQMNQRKYAGYHDWKLASIAEYRTIEDRAFYAAVFGGLPQHAYWARNVITKNVASYIGLFEGWAVSGNKDGYNFGYPPIPRSARLVRRSE
jgi:hypothetical protein